jgi:hypothetical protein
MIYQESDWIKQEYGSMTNDRLMFTIQNRHQYLPAHAARCLKELKLRRNDNTTK